jgi:hypothetical protein
MFEKVNLSIKKVTESLIRINFGLVSDFVAIFDNYSLKPELDFSKT